MRNRLEETTIWVFFGLMATGIVYLLFDIGTIPSSYLGDFTITQLCALIMVIFTIIAMLKGVI